MRRPPLYVLLCALMGSSLVFTFLRESEGAGRRPRPKSTIDIGFEVAPVQLDLRGKNRRLVGYGSYLVNVTGACNDCHTNPPYAEGGNPHLGEPKLINVEHYLAGGTPFGPGVVSSNITPDEHGLPAGHTYREFERAMRTGRHEHDDHGTPHPHALDNEVMQVMPWPFYANLLERDLRAMYEYLKAIPHAEPAPPAEPPAQ